MGLLCACPINLSETITPNVGPTFAGFEDIQIKVVVSLQVLV